MNCKLEVGEYKNMRTILIVLDSLGVGALPDAGDYNDVGSNTLGNIAASLNGRIKLPHLAEMGIGNIIDIKGISPVMQPSAVFGKAMTFSPGKDTTTGHWELAGIHLEKPFPVFPEGFPAEVINKFEKKIGRKSLGNKVASGTVIINELGEMHCQTGYPIVYTSADSVFQVAAHGDIVPVELLYSWCELARDMLTGEVAVGRVIARPFLGKPAAFVRTARRKDFSLSPVENTLLDMLTLHGREVLAVGKINDIFAGRGISKKYKTSSNKEGLQATLDLIKGNNQNSFIFTNLVDFDMLYGHRNDVLGYSQALEEFDTWLPEIKKHLRKDDLLLITADHGCDPTHPGTDHTREYVPVLGTGSLVKKIGLDLGVLTSLADIGATVAEHMQVPALKNGKSFLKEILH